MPVCFTLLCVHSLPGLGRIYGQVPVGLIESSPRTLVWGSLSKEPSVPVGTIEKSHIDPSHFVWQHKRYSIVSAGTHTLKKRYPTLKCGATILGSLTGHLNITESKSPTDFVQDTFSLYCYALGQVARFIDVAAEMHSEIVSKQLERHDGENRR